MVQTLHEILGPDADMLTDKVDRARDGAELRQLAEKHRELMVSIGQRRRAEAFVAQVEQLLAGP